MSRAQLAMLVKLARPRTWVFASVMWATAYLSTGSARLGMLLVGVAICFLMTAATNLLNVYTDRVEDSVNLRERAEMVSEVGERRLRWAIFLCYAFPLLVAAIFTPLPHVLVCGIGAVNSITYSWGPRFKARPFLSLASLSGVVVLPFIAGWVMVRSFTEVSPIVIVFAVALFAYANLKNFPDAEGDLKAGVRTVFNSYSPQYVRRFVLASMLAPYVLLVAFIAAGVLPVRFLIALPFAAGPLLIVHPSAPCATPTTRKSCMQ
jgi:4-hydroxybenzoate polyprenyltransferase